MKNLIVLFVFALFLPHCNNYDNKQTKSSAKEEKKVLAVKLIGHSLKSVKLKEKELGIQLEFEIVDIVNLDINGDKKYDVINIERIKNWGDPGDFHKISIHLSGQEEMEFFNEAGWVTIGEYELQFSENLNAESFSKSKYVTTYKLSDKDTILLCFGYVYASQPGLLTIINLTHFNEPTLIFNDNYHLYSLSDINKNGDKDLTVSKFDIEELMDVKTLEIFTYTNGWYHKAQ